MRVVLCCGCFDIIHPGHIAHLRAARALGDRLVVALTGDAFVNKGPGRPVFNQDQRASVLRELRCVSEVIIYQEPIPEQVIHKLRPDIYCKGSEYKGRLPEKALVERMGGRVAFTNGPVFSSTKLVEMV